MLLENFVLLTVLANKASGDRKHKGFHITAAFFRFFVGHKHTVTNIQQIFLPLSSEDLFA